MLTELSFSEVDEKVLNASRPVVLKFWNEGCGPCQALAPVVDEISDETEDVDFFSINIGSSREIAEQFNVMAAPTLLFIKGGVVVKKVIGFKPKDGIQEIIKTYFQ